MISCELWRSERMCITSAAVLRGVFSFSFRGVIFTTFLPGPHLRMSVARTCERNIGAHVCLVGALSL